MKEIIRSQDKMYILFEDDAGYILSAMCGGIGMYEVKVRLNSDEAASYRTEGEGYVEALAYDLGREPNKYRCRTVS
jgi:hypothetical protein